MNNQGANILLYSDKLAMFEYGKSHPFKPERARQLMELLNRYNLIFESNQKIIEPEPLAEELLYTFHGKEYINLLRQCSTGKFEPAMLEAGLGTSDNPVIKGIYEFALQAAGATWQGTQMLLNNEARFAFNPVGGFHHGGKDHAEGFCYVNDIALAITECLKKGCRVAYIDIDVHHGNGIQDAFY
ncbi:MAG: acetoin utilization protein AcuC, partial [bacterium]|nr:acetoin utilization protein AcuC [bacterium]